MGEHQRYVPSPLLFRIVMDERTKDERNSIPWELMHADGLVFTDVTEQEVVKKFKKWKKKQLKNEE